MSRSTEPRLLLALVAGTWALGFGADVALLAQTASEAPATSGRDLYQRACVACHGPDGTGQPQAIVGFDTPLPDFTDCSFSTPEPDADWMAVVHEGGPVRGFDRRMPAFGEALTEEDILTIVGHLRTFCPSASWPRGELNLPRALVTEKAFPENEAVWTTGVAASGPGAIGNEFIYERRFGARSQFELVVPVELQAAQDGGWRSGLGDLAAAVKQVVFHSLPRGTIVSVAGELILPTGKENAGLGNGVTVVEPFVAIGQILPSDGFLQLQAGLEIPFDRRRASREAFWRAAAGKSFIEGRFGRTWSPMVELLAARELEGGETTKWDALPQMQVTLSKRQHVMVSGGVRLPLNEREGRGTQVLLYLLWDWFDGSIFSGW